MGSSREVTISPRWPGRRHPQRDQAAWRTGHGGSEGLRRTERAAEFGSCEFSPHALTRRQYTASLDPGTEGRSATHQKMFGGGGRKLSSASKRLSRRVSRFLTPALRGAL